MRIRSLTILLLILGMSCIGGMCSKDGDKNGGDDSGDDNYQEPVLKADATWSYLTSDDMLYGNSRPVTRKWIATKQNSALAVLVTGSDPAFRSIEFHFENT